MPQNSISAQLSNLQQLVADLEAIENGGKKAISNTIKDVKARAPGWIAQEVTAVYNIKKSEITPSGSGKSKKMAGSIQITGETIEELAITYKGRLLTPVHFGMTPKAPPRGKSYTLKAQVLKGQKKVVGRYLFLSTPSARRATAKTETKSLFSYKLYNILHEFRRALIYNGSKNYPNHAKRLENPVRRCRKNAENSPFAPGRETQNNSRPSCSKGG